MGLNDKTHTSGAVSDALHRELDEVLRRGSPHIILVHELRAQSFGAPFKQIIDATPSHLTWTRDLSKRLYKELAIMLCGSVSQSVDSATGNVAQNLTAVGLHLLLNAIAVEPKPAMGTVGYVEVKHWRPQQLLTKTRALRLLTKPRKQLPPSSRLPSPKPLESGGLRLDVDSMWEVTRRRSAPIRLTERASEQSRTPQRGARRQSLEHRGDFAGGDSEDRKSLPESRRSNSNPGRFDGPLPTILTDGPDKFKLDARRRSTPALKNQKSAFACGHETGRRLSCERRTLKERPPSERTTARTSPADQDENQGAELDRSPEGGGSPWDKLRGASGILRC